MAPKAKATVKVNALIASVDVGQGEVKGVSTETDKVITFEPCIAPMTKAKAMHGDSEKPGVSLRGEDRNSVEVFGLADCYRHGQHELIRRFNGSDRYTSDDYVRLFRALALQLFAAHRGGAPIKPTMALSLPIDIYNDTEKRAEIVKRLEGTHRLMDYEGCELVMEIEPKKLLALPESTGAIFHYHFDPDTLNSRVPVSGTTLVIDWGYETVNTSWFDGLFYNRDRSLTVFRAGFGVLVRDLAKELAKNFGRIDVTHLDVALRKLAAKNPMQAKPTDLLPKLEITPGVFADVTGLYRDTLAQLAGLAAAAIGTHYQQRPTRILLAGGTQAHGAMHLVNALSGWGADIQIVPEYYHAGVVGALTFLKRLAVSR